MDTTSNHEAIQSIELLLYCIQMSLLKTTKSSVPSDLFLKTLRNAQKDRGTSTRALYNKQKSSTQELQLTIISINTWTASNQTFGHLWCTLSARSLVTESDEFDGWTCR